MVSFVQKYGLLKNWRFFFALLWPLILLPIIVIGKSTTAKCAYAVAILAGFWMTEAIPIPITSLMPMFLYPIMGIQSSEILAHEYLKDSIMIFVGGLLIALAFEYCGLHKRIALRVILFTGTSVKMLMLGIMSCTMSLSMWMSNTAVAAMMVPIITAVLEELDLSLRGTVQNEELEYIETDEKGCVNKTFEADEDDENRTEENLYEPDAVELNEIRERVDSTSSRLSVKEQPRKLSIKFNDTVVFERKLSVRSTKIVEFMQNTRTMFLLSCAYAANIGGTGVITGSGTNLVAVEFLGNLDPKHHGNYSALTFTTWLSFNILPAILNLTLAWVYLQLMFLGLPPKWKFWNDKNKTCSKHHADNSEGLTITPEIETKIKEMLQIAYDNLGKVTAHEKGVFASFCVAVISFIFHDPKFIPGWKELFPKSVSISTSALLVSVLFFVVPRNEEFYAALAKRDFSGVTFKPLLDWSFVKKKFPWGVVILLGGGYAMSNGAKKAGLSTVLGQSLKAFAGFPPQVMLAIICVMIAFITEIASNTATATLVVPILLEVSKELDIHPLYLTLPATVVCSYAFMLPVATPPNAIVYAASGMRVTDMIKTGFFMNCSCILVLYVCTISYGNLIFRFNDYHYMP